MSGGKWNGSTPCGLTIFLIKNLFGLNRIMRSIKYKDNWFNYYSSAKFSGKSILTGNRFSEGESIFWCKGIGGFPETELTIINSSETNKNKSMYHKGPCDTNLTYDDSASRQRAKQVFKKEYGIDLFSHPGLYIPELKNNSNFIEYCNGQYCEDLIGIDKNDPDKLILVEVERSNKTNLFDDKNTENITILASKYWKYFDEGNKNHIHYMCFINEELGKACVIKGTDIKFNRGNYTQIQVNSNSIKEFYEIPKKFGKIYNLDNSLEKILDMSKVEYCIK